MIFAGLAAWRASGFAPQVCIVGSGPAGLSLALGLGGRGVPCLVLEAGGFGYTAQSQDFYRGAVVGDAHADLRDARLRQFGGTSGHWEGWCRPLDAVDFEARAGMPDSGWPIGKADLDPYAKATEAILEIAPPAPDRAVTPELNEIAFSMSPPVRFAAKYREAIAASRSIGLLVDSPVIDLVPGAGRIDAVVVRDGGGGDQRLQAPLFALCTGGVENSRLLLWANQRHRGGVVPGARTLGRYWMDHPHFGVGDAILTGFPEAAPRGIRFFAPSAQVLRANPIGNLSLRVFSGSNRLKRLFKSGMCVAPEFFDALMHEHAVGYACGVRLLAVWEQAPVADNRITLDGEHDALGLPRVRLHWRKGPIERETVARVVHLYGRYLIDADLGRLRLPAWLAQQRDYPQSNELMGFHHMGGTRMATSADKGVVDAHCKVFGVDNLYVGGSSVFATSGHANPTYTIVQLALRLADHLADRLRTDTPASHASQLVTSSPIPR